jgi:Serine/threonine protein kinase involved in cell cycle control
LLIDPSSRQILSEKEAVFGNSLPCISIPRWSRVAHYVQTSINRQFGQHAIVLDFSPGNSYLNPLVVAQVSSFRMNGDDAGRVWIDYADLAEENLLCDEKRWIELLLKTGESGRGFYSRLEWMPEVLEWIRSTSPGTDCTLQTARQLNASGQSALFSIKEKGGKKFWFKSSKEEYDLSLHITDAFSAYTPDILASHSGWSAWLMEDFGSSLAPPSKPNIRRLRSLGRQLARLQIESSAKLSSLLSHGCQDLRTDSLRTVLPRIVDCLECLGWPGRRKQSAMQRDGSRGETLANILDDWDDICIPDVLLHTDLNLNNVLVGRGRCVFIDWAEAAVGNPFANFHQLRVQLSRCGVSPVAFNEFSTCYLSEWSSGLTRLQINQALRLSPVVEMVTRLCARQRWLLSGTLSAMQIASCSNALLKQLDAAMSEFRPDLALTG